MRLTLIFTLLALLVATVVTILYAAPGKTSKKPVLTEITASVEGFNCPSCTGKLQSYLAEQKGISEAKVTMKPQQVTAKLDEKVMPISKFITLINAHGKKTEPKAPYSAKLVVYVDAEMCKDQGKMCPPCFDEIKKMVKGVKGITGVALDKTGKVATLSFDPKANVTTKAIADALKKSKFKFIVSFTDPKAAVKKTAAAAGGDDCCAGEMHAQHSEAKSAASGESCEMGSGAESGAESGGGCPMVAGH
ncbi:MAG: variable large family protein [Armatimonadota bacterium]